MRHFGNFTNFSYIFLLNDLWPFAVHVFLVFTAHDSDVNYRLRDAKWKPELFYFRTGEATVSNFLDAVVELYVLQLITVCESAEADFPEGGRSGEVL